MNTSGRPLAQPSERRLVPEHPRREAIVAAHAAALSRGDSGYLDPSTGLFVMTARSLLERGDCCDSGCRHCPYVD